MDKSPQPSQSPAPPSPGTRGPSASQKVELLGIELLGKSVLFQSMTTDVLKSVWDTGSMVSLHKGQKLDISSDSVEFLNLVLSGQLTVQRLTAAREAATRTAGPGFVFGSIDSVLGTGKFLSAVVVSDSKVFTLHRNALSMLLVEFPDLSRHMSRIRLAVSMRVAQEFQKRLEIHESLASAGTILPKVQVAPRLPVAGRNLFAVLGNGEWRRIDNISDTGLFILEQSPTPVGEEIQFVLRDKSNVVETVELAGIVARQVADGFGVKLSKLSERPAAVWEQLVTSALSLEIDTVFRPKLTNLEKPLPVQFVSEGFYRKGQIVSLGIEGAVLHSSTKMHKRKLELMLSLAPGGKSATPLKVESEILGKKPGEYLIRFDHLAPEQEALIRLFLVEPVDLEKSDEIPAEQERDLPNNLRRLIPNAVALCELYFRELREQVILLPGSIPQRRGERVRVEVVLSYEAIPVAKSRNVFCLPGRISRVSGGGAVVDLDAAATSAINEIKNLAEMVARKRTENAFSHAVEREHNVKNRRYIQFILIAALLLACVWWARHASQVEPQEEEVTGELLNSSSSCVGIDSRKQKK